MKKKLLVVLLALTLVFAFAVTAMAATTGDAAIRVETDETFDLSHSQANVTSGQWYRLEVSGGGIVGSPVKGLPQQASSTTVNVEIEDLVFATTVLGQTEITYKVLTAATGDSATWTTVANTTDKMTAYVGRAGKSLAIESFVARKGAAIRGSNGDTDLPPLNDSAGKIVNVDWDADSARIKYISLSPGAKLSISGATFADSEGTETTYETDIIKVAGLNSDDPKTVRLTVKPENGEPSAVYTYKIIANYDIAELESVSLGGVDGVIDRTAETVTLQYDPAKASLFKQNAIDSTKYDITGIEIGVNTFKKDNYPVVLEGQGGFTTSATNIAAAALPEFGIDLRGGSTTASYDDASFTIRVNAIDANEFVTYTVTLKQKVNATGINFYGDDVLETKLTGGNDNKGTAEVVVNDKTVIYVRANVDAAERPELEFSGDAYVDDDPVVGMTNAYEVTLNTTGEQLIITPDGGLPQEYTIRRGAVVVPSLDGDVHTVASGGTSKGFTLTGGTTLAGSVTLSSSYSNTVYLTFDETVSAVKVGNTDADVVSGRYKINTGGSNTDVKVTYGGKTYTLTIKPYSTSYVLRGDIYRTSTGDDSTPIDFTTAHDSASSALSKTIASSWNDPSKVYLEFDDSLDDDAVSYKNENKSSWTTADYSSSTDRYTIPLAGETTVRIEYDSGDYCFLEINPDGDVVLAGRVNDDDSSGGESFSFTSTSSKTVKVDEDWDDGKVYIYIKSSTYSGISQSDVRYSDSNVSSMDSTKFKKLDESDKDGDYYEIELDGDTYVWILYDDDYYKLIIKPDGAAESDSLIDSVEADSKSNGKGTSFLAFYGADEIYIFKPYDAPSSTYLKINSDEDVIYEEEDDDDKEGEWISVDDGDKVTVDDEEYTIEIIEASKNDDDDADLSSLSAKAGTKSSNLATATLSPSFTSSTTKYSASIGSTNTYGRLTAKLSDSSAHMIIEGFNKYSGSKSQDFDFKSLSTKTNNFKYTIHVVAEDCEETESYEVTFSRTGGVTALKSLSVSGGILTPAFDAKTLSYTAYTSSATATISASAEDSGANITVYGYAKNTTLGSKSGTGSVYGDFTLAEGINTFTVTVSKSGATSTTYYVSIYRIPASPLIQVSNQNITVNGTGYTLAAYNINGNNFVKLRDLAALLSNTNKRFSLEFTDATQTAKMISGGNYDRRGDELSPLPKFTRWGPSTQIFMLDGKNIYPMAYNIDGTNYVMIRDMGSVMNFYVGYTASTATVIITTSANYTP